MKIKSIALTIPMAITLWSCQSESPQEIQSPKNVLSVKASLPGSDNTRAIIKYGDYEDSSREELIWVKDILVEDHKESDYIKLFNISRFEETHYKKETPCLDIVDISGKTAKFESVTRYPDFPVKAGDVLLAVQGFADPTNLNEVAEGSSNVISYQASSTLYDQKIVENPTSYTALPHMYCMQHMYDIVKVEEDDKIPDLHFKHFNAIIRVTLQNKTGKPLFTKPSDIVFTTSSKDKSTFIFGFNYFSVVGDDDNGFHLEENFKTKSDQTTWLSNKTTLKINEKDSLKIPLKDGETYEFYAVTTPRIGRPEIPQEVIEKFTIDVYDGVESGFYAGYENTSKYTITIDDFNRAIEPGKRYWFKLTACNEKDGEEEVDDRSEGDNTGKKKQADVYKLMLTSKWEANQQKNEESND